MQSFGVDIVNVRIAEGTLAFLGSRWLARLRKDFQALLHLVESRLVHVLSAFQSDTHRPQSAFQQCRHAVLLDVGIESPTVILLERLDQRTELIEGAAQGFRLPCQQRLCATQSDLIDVRQEVDIDVSSFGQGFQLLARISIIDCNPSEAAGPSPFFFIEFLPSVSTASE